MIAAALLSGLFFLDCAVAKPAETAGRFTAQQAWDAGQVSLTKSPPLVWAVDEARRVMWPVSASYPGKKYAMAEVSPPGMISAAWPNEGATRELAIYEAGAGTLSLTTVNADNSKLPRSWSWGLKCSTVPSDQ